MKITVYVVTYALDSDATRGCGPVKTHRGVRKATGTRLNLIQYARNRINDDSDIE